jgi:universal stress protein E
MKQPESILVVLDKPKHEQAALERARVLAAAAGAHLHLTSYCWLAMADQPEVFDTHQRRALKRSVVKERERWLRDLVLDAGLAAADVSTEVVWTRDIADWVRQRTTRDDIDLVVKSVHKSATLMHTPLDWQLLRECPVPVLLAATGGGRRSGNVLAALDFRHTDRKHQLLNFRVLDAANTVAALVKGKVHCVSAVESSAQVAGLEIANAPRLERHVKQHTRALLEALVAPLELPRARLHTPVGKVGVAVAATAARLKADLLVVGSSARRGVGALVLGNSAEKILTRVGCDVLAVHP